MDDFFHSDFHKYLCKTNPAITTVTSVIHISTDYYYYY